jgi:drug/metabolite transporter (DMT)-like permease
MKTNLRLGVLISLLCAFFYSTQTALVKNMADILPPLPIVIFMQSLIALLLLLPFLFKKGLPHILAVVKTKNPGLQFLRAFSSLSLSYLLFYSVKFIPLVNAMLLINTSPLIVPFIAYFFMSQRINHKLWFPIAMGFIGVMIVLQPDARIFNWASLLDLVGAVCMAVSMLLVRKTSATDSSDTTTFYFLFFATCMSSVVSIPFWQPMTANMWMPLFAIGGLYFLVQCTTTYALKFANAQLVSTLFYSNIIFAAILSQLLWHTFPSSTTWVGVVLIVAGGILCIRAEHTHNKQSHLLSDLNYVRQT